MATKPSTILEENLSMIDGDCRIATATNMIIGIDTTRAITLENQPLLINTGTNSAIATAKDPHFIQVKINRLEMTDS